MPPTMTVAKAHPSAPSLNDVENNIGSIPVVQATPDPRSSHVAIPAIPAGMVAKSITTTYSDGRQETITELVNPGASTITGAVPTSPTPAASVTVSQYHPPRVDLGARPIKITCPYCNQTEVTKTRSQFGVCTIISVVVLVICFFPLFWVPFICPSVSSPLIFILTINLVKSLLTAAFPRIFYCGIQQLSIMMGISQCLDYEHICRKCGRLVGKSKAECCSSG